MAQPHCVIVGNGPAANEAAFTLRANAADARITIIGEEPAPFYRSHFLPDYIAGNVSQEGLNVNPPAFYKSRGIKLRLGQRVVSADFSRRTLLLDHHECVAFDGLIMATGGRPRIPEPLQVFEDLMLTLKTLEDAVTWTRKLERTDSILIVGGDLTSLSLTAALISLGKRVSFMLNDESFWPVPLTEEVRCEVAGRLAAKDVEVLPGGKIKRVTKISADSVEVQVGDWTRQFGILGAFFGLVPNVKFLAGSGLDIERGLLVDEHLKTRFDGVYAAGDCAQVYHPGINNYWVSIGYENARSLGRIAALNLAGGMFTPEVSSESIFTVDGIRVNTSWWLEF
jgi:NAD(P)H-nitrite reductase large subunit